MSANMQESERQRPISYRSKNATVCPICSYEFRRELLHSGGGRLIAAELTPELRRTYESSKKYGAIHTLAYPVVTCPKCLYSGLQGDYSNINDDEKQAHTNAIKERWVGIEKIMGRLDFHKERDLRLGAASYLLAIDCYQRRARRVAPTAKKAVCSLRAAWLFSDLHKQSPQSNFHKVSDLLYSKAWRYYHSLLNIMSRGDEPQEQFMSILGPDTDKNWGFDGVIYINSYLVFKRIERLSLEKEAKIKMLDEARRNLGRLYGYGRYSADRPSPIVNLARDLYGGLGEMLKKEGVAISASEDP